MPEIVSRIEKWKPTRKTIVMRSETFRGNVSKLIHTVNIDPKQLMIVFRVESLGADVDVGVPIEPGDLLVCKDVVRTSIDDMYHCKDVDVRAVLPKSEQTGHETEESEAGKYGPLSASWKERGWPAPLPATNGHLEAVPAQS